MAAQLYRCRSAARSLLGDEFDERIAPWKAAIADHMQRERRTVLQALIDLGGYIHKADVDGLLLMLLTAAAVEMIEPSPPSPARFTPSDPGTPIGSA
ncbi:MAG TPA: hypothetical protein VN654_24045 [Vicinamibacterales bacterium]|nr:hypothetical protein [Vicinamibacterales bacterium]